MTPEPPQSLQAEQELLGTLLAYYKPELVHVAQAAGLKRGDFYRHAHEVIYRAVLVLHRDGVHVDTATVARFLSKEFTREDTPRSFLDAVGGVAQLDLVASFSVVNGFRERCLIVAEDGKWRRWIRALYEAAESAHTRDDKRFWAAIGKVKESIPEGAELKAIRGGKAA